MTDVYFEPEPREEIDQDELEAFLLAETNGRLSVRPRLTWQPLEEVDMRSIVFRDKPLLQADALHLVAGRKGQGKGTLLAEIAARVNRGELGAPSGTSSGSVPRTARQSTSGRASKLQAATLPAC